MPANTENLTDDHDLVPEDFPACECIERSGRWVLGLDCGGLEIVHGACGTYLAGDWWTNAKMDGTTTVTMAYTKVYPWPWDGVEQIYLFKVTPLNKVAAVVDEAYCACGSTDGTWVLGMALGGDVTLVHRPCGQGILGEEEEWRSATSTTVDIPVDITFPVEPGDPIRLVPVREGN